MQTLIDPTSLPWNMEHHLVPQTDGSDLSLLEAPKPPDLAHVKNGGFFDPKILRSITKVFLF